MSGSGWFIVGFVAGQIVLTLAQSIAVVIDRWKHHKRGCKETFS